MTQDQSTSMVPSITNSTVAFVSQVISAYCLRRGYTIAERLGGDYPASKLHNMRIIQERCNLEYPLLKKRGHFTSGIVLTLEELHPGDVLLFFRSYSEPDPDIVGSGEGLISLTQCQKRTFNNEESMEFSIQKAIKIAMREDDLRLTRFKGPRLD